MPELLKARKDLSVGTISDAQFKVIEDRAVIEAIRLQEEARLEVVTDGEMRRLSFQSQFTEAVDGLGEHDIDHVPIVGDRERALEPLLAVRGVIHGKARLRQAFDHERGDLFVILNDQDPH